MPGTAVAACRCMSVDPRALSLPLLLAAACTAGGPAIDPIEDQVVAVGDELSIEIAATSGDAAGVRYDVTSNAPDLGDRAGLAPRPDGTALFRWRPNAADVGTWVFDFTATDGAGSSTESVQIDVRSTIGDSSIPLFRRPLGAGVAIDGADDCVEVAIETTDQDSPEVAIAEEEPLIEGAALLQDGAMSATWRWCPTEEQRALRDRYLLTLSADDGDGPKAIKRYQIILREEGKSGCAGAEPVIDHVAADRETVNDLEVVARVEDDRGLKAAPLLYYAIGPASPPEARSMVQAAMRLEKGDLREGTWRGAIPNPVGRAEPGSHQAIHYLLVAEDDDDPLDRCDHVAARGFQMEVTSPGGDGELAACSPCTADNQCGGPADHCLRMGVEGEAFCTTACTADDPCGEGAICSRVELESIEGVRGRQCVPVDESCQPAAACENDALEGNDSQARAQLLPPGTTGELTLCPVGDFGGEEDWYRLELAGDAEVAIALDGAAEPDMDLLLVRDGGPWVAMTGQTGSQDRIAACLPGGGYLLRVDSLVAGENRYALTWSRSAASCAEEPATCVEDRSEDDDDLGAARLADLGAGAYRSADNSICADDDWYALELAAGETLHATLAFAVSGPGQDLDFHVHDASGVDLTPCSVEVPWECSANGQSGGAGERIQFTAPATDAYYLVVRGWDGSTNAYDLCASLSAAGCP